MDSLSRVHTPTSIEGQADNAAWLALVLGNLPQAVLVEGSDRVIRMVNHQFCRLFDFDEEPSMLTGRSTDDVFTGLHPFFENTSHYLHRVGTIIHQQKTIHNEVLKLQDGRLILRDYIPLLYQDHCSGHLWLFSVQTEKIEAEALLQEQRKFYEDILNNIPSDIAVFSPDHKYLFVNPVGVKDPDLRKWLIGKTDHDYCMLRGKDMAFADKRRDVFNEIIALGKEREWEERIINRRGETEYHLRKMSPLYDENKNLVWLIGYSVNITERKRIEEQIQLSEKRYRDLFNYSQAIICTHDLEGNFLSVNPSLLEVLGYEEKEIIGRNIRDLLLPEDHAGFSELYLESIRNNSKVKGLFRVLHKNGSKVYLLYQNYKVAESPESEAYIIAFAQDVSDRIRAEKELKEAKKITEETARNKEKFLANMSHEIRTPMNGIIGITSFLQKTQLTSEQSNYLNIIQESAHDLLTIINDILDLEKVGTGQIQLESIPFDIIAKTKTSIRLFELSARNKNVAFEFINDIGDELCVVGDPTRFSQSMNNLISNAVKFTHKGKIAVKVSATAESGERITLAFTVQDSGIGIDPGNIDKIFQPFTQAYPETARKYGGTGLGLAITKNLVELQGGAIWVESTPKKGSAFHFSLTYTKCTESQKKLLETVHHPTRNILGELKILVAEDNRVNQFLTKDMLQQLGFKTTIAGTGAEVLNYLRADDYDLVLMDIQMPEKNGYEAAKEIRRLPGNKKNIPIIALTAHAFKGEERNYTASGMNGYLTKPFSENALYQAITRVLDEQKSSGIPIEENMNKKNIAGEPTAKLYDLTLVNELARGNQEFVANLAKIFIETVPPTARDMVEACREKKWEQMGKLAHKLKSTIDTMCIASLKDDIRIIEKSGKEQKNLDTIHLLVDKADSVIRQVTEQLKEEFSL